MTDRILKILDISVLALLGLTTLFSLVFPAFMHFDAGIFYRVAISAAGFLFILRAKLLKTEDKIETPIDAHLFLLFIWTIITVINARNWFVSFNAAVGFFVLLLFYYMVYAYARKYSRHFTVFLAAAVSLLCLYGLYQYFFGFSDTLQYLAAHPTDHDAALIDRIKSGRVFSTLIYPNSFAGLLVLAIPVAAGLIKNEKKLRLLFIPVLALLAANLVLTKSLGAFISLIAAVTLVFFSASDPALRAFKNYLLAILALSAVIFGAVLYIRGPEHVIPALIPRFESWLKMLDIARHYPITGTGPGSFEEIYNNGGFSASPYLKFAHNAALQAMIELGLPGLIIILLAAFYSVRSILQNFYFTRTPQRKVAITALLTGLIAFLLHNMADFDIYNFELALVFTAALAVLMSQVTIGSIEIKKIKLTYLLGLNPGKRRSVVFACILAVLAFSAVTAGKFSPVLSLIYIFITSAAAIWSVSKEDIRVTNLDMPVLSLAALSVISLTYTPDLYTGLKYLTMYAAAIGLYYLYSQFLRRYTYKIIITNFLIWTGVILCGVALIQYGYRYFTHDPAGLFADAFFPNNNIFAAYLALPFGFLLSRVLFEKRINFLGLKIFMLFVFIITAGLARSKAGMLQTGFVFAGMWAYYRFYRDAVKDAPGRIAFKSGLMKVLLVFILGTSFTPLLPSGEKILNAGLGMDPQLMNRSGMYKATVEMIKEKPLFGWGLGSYEKVFPAYNFPADGIARYQFETPFAHNDLLQAGQSLGLAGLACLLWLIISLFLNTPEREGHRKVWAATAGAYFGLAGLILGSLFHFHLQVPGIIMTAAILAGMISREKYSIRTLPKEALFFTKIYYFPALIFIFILFSIAVKPAASWYLNSQYAKTKNYSFLSSGLQVEPLNPSYDFRIGLILEESSSFTDALARFKDSLRHDPRNYITLLHAARVSRNLGDYAGASDFYSLALSANPFRAFTMSETANFYITGMNNPDKAQEYLLKAINTEPNYAGARHSLALLRMQKGMYREALLEFDSIEEILTYNKPLTAFEKSLLDLPLETLFFNKAKLLNIMENFEESCYYYKKSYAISKNAETLEAMAVVCGRGAR